MNNEKNKDEEIWEDPIVKEIHEIRAEIAKKYNYDLHEYCEAMRKKEKEHGNRVVSFDKKKK